MIWLVSLTFLYLASFKGVVFFCFTLLFWNTPNFCQLSSHDEFISFHLFLDSNLTNIFFALNNNNNNCKIYNCCHENVAISFAIAFAHVPWYIHSHIGKNYHQNWQLLNVANHFQVAKLKFRLPTLTSTTDEAVCIIIEHKYNIWLFSQCMTAWLLLKNDCSFSPMLKMFTSLWKNRFLLSFCIL